MEKCRANIKLSVDVKRREINAVEDGSFKGITTLSGLVEIALIEILDKKDVP